MEKTGTKTDTGIKQIQEQDYKKSLYSIIKKVEDSKHRAITIVNKLLRDLRVKYPDMGGFSSGNLQDCKRFYITYSNSSKLRTLFVEINRNNNLTLHNFSKTPATVWRNYLH
ncbi:MAG: hypothetical protein CVT88_00420 [Candidatus Altiarchaeales archaeon HGW-Altiarchaeales-1]|nr:MAG: hypothetical protein CVT88_00420 [Candidatus Altiarchaeales archaeon HGW-Altiarchaeales-1]